METQRKVLLVSVAGIVVVLGAMIAVGGYLIGNAGKHPAIRPIPQSAVGLAKPGAKPGEKGGTASQTASSAAVSATGNGVITSAEFSRVVLDGAWDTTITRAESPSVRIVAPADVSKNVDTATRNGELTLGFKRGVAIISSGRVSAFVQTPSLSRVTVRGGARVTIADFSVPELAVDISGAGNIVGERNSIKILRLHSAGAAHIDFGRSDVTDASLAIDGAGHVVLNMTGGTLSGQINGVGTVDYSGIVSAESVHVSGLGSVRHIKGE